MSQQVSENRGADEEAGGPPVPEQPGRLAPPTVPISRSTVPAMGQE